jgi:hypothetical protein
MGKAPPKEPKEKKVKTPKEPREPKERKTPREPKEPKEKKPKVKKSKPIAGILQQLKDINTLKIKRNEWNNFEDADTRMVFDSVSEKVIGRQSDDGEVVPLDAEDMLLCDERNFQY